MRVEKLSNAVREFFESTRSEPLTMEELRELAHQVSVLVRIYSVNASILSNPTTPAEVSLSIPFYAGQLLSSIYQSIIQTSVEALEKFGEARLKRDYVKV